MNFLGIDTSGEYLTIIARRGERRETRFLRDCARAHSVRLMQEVDGALKSLDMKPSDCDFFAVTVGPGSFTGIRIGISAVKGLCLATNKPALEVTSFDVLAYAEKEEKLLCIVDAGHGFVYAAGYDKGILTIPPAYCSNEEAETLVKAGYRKIDWKSVNPAKGFFGAVEANCQNTVAPQELSALYLRKSSAEENLIQRSLQ